MSSKKNFRITLNLSHFFTDHRSVCRMFVHQDFNEICDLQEHISKIYNIKGFYLTTQNSYLPPSEDIRILQADDVVQVITNEAKQNYEASHYCCCTLNGESIKCRKRKRKKLDVDELETDLKDAEKKKKKNPKKDDDQELNIDYQIPSNSVEYDQNNSLEFSDKKSKRGKIKRERYSIDCLQVSKKVSKKRKIQLHSNISLPNIHKERLKCSGDEGTFNNEEFTDENTYSTKNYSNKNPTSRDQDNSDQTNDNLSQRSDNRTKQVNCHKNSHTLPNRNHGTDNIRGRQTIKPNKNGFCDEIDDESKEESQNIESSNVNAPLEISSQIILNNLQMELNSEQLADIKKFSESRSPINFFPRRTVRKNILSSNGIGACLNKLRTELGHFLSSSKESRHVTEENVLSSQMSKNNYSVEHVGGGTENTIVDTELNNGYTENTSGDVENVSADMENSRRDVENTREDMKNASGDMENSKRDVENTSGDLENTSGYMENTNGNLESGDADFEVKSGDLNYSLSKKRKRKRHRKRKTVTHFTIAENFFDDKSVVFKPPNTAVKPRTHIKFDEDEYDEDDGIQNNLSQESETFGTKSETAYTDTNTYREVESLSFSEPKTTVCQKAGNAPDGKLEPPSCQIEETPKDTTTYDLSNILKYPLIREEATKVGDVIAFKTYVLDNYNPKISNWVVGKVMDLSNDTKEVQVEIKDGKDELQPVTGKFSMEDSEEEFQDLQLFQWSSLIEPRLLSQQQIQ